VSRVLQVPVPEPGQLVDVRRRRYVVVDIAQSPLPPDILTLNNWQSQRLITLSSVEDDAPGEELQVIWEIEPGATAIDKSPLPRPVGFDVKRLKKRLFLATDAASEGIYLQNHFSRLIHYEIPWNPNRQEQRNGRTTLRELNREMDEAVAKAYGWKDLQLEHGFHETKQGLRYTISEAARREVLDRLLLLNHQRHEEEVKAGLFEQKGSKGKRNVKGVVKEVGGSGMYRLSGAEETGNVEPLVSEDVAQGALFSE
jgi:hypothetical protein